MKINELLVKTLTTYDADRKRSQQKEVGVSQIGGCRRQVWHQLQGTPKENETLKLPALMGTAIHKMIESAFTQTIEEEWADYWLEQEFERDGIKGHVDMYIPAIGAVIDWKTTKLRNLEYFPSKQQRWQVQLYAWLIKHSGATDPKTVTLVAIPRDGDERNIKIHTEEYNEDIAMEAIAWYREVQNMTEAPEPERYAAQFCQHYCSYFGTACGGKGKEKTEATITDSDTVKIVEKYVEVSDNIRELEKTKDALKAVLENTEGVTPDGIKVAWSQTAGRKMLDEEYVAYFFEKHGEPIPYKQGNPSMRLVVK
jgi:hypothetical protein